jgi:hypothetical protein
VDQRQERLLRRADHRLRLRGGHLLLRQLCCHLLAQEAGAHARSHLQQRAYFQVDLCLITINDLVGLTRLASTYVLIFGIALTCSTLTTFVGLIFKLYYSKWESYFMAGLQIQDSRQQSVFRIHTKILNY